MHPRPVVRRLLHDNVLWEDQGEYYFFDSNRPIAVGPLCPKDQAELLYRETRRANMTTCEVQSAQYVGYDGDLICPECNQTYTLGQGRKQVGASRREVEARFAGRRRQAENQPPPTGSVA
ncbi:MAG: hypothetical protein HY690_18255 [Chloroflexi bacterium]|nr:hypothetical protein [Chloroflexota bacterium]